MKTLLFIIDMQNDFCSPKGALYVPGAEADVSRVCRLLRRNREKIDGIILTQDSHQVMDIAHPGSWHDRTGACPAPFTGISAADVLKGKWIPAGNKEQVIRYLEELAHTGEYAHTIWPEHCIQGSEGAAITAELMQEVKDWARQGKYFSVVPKGLYPLTEHFGAFRANVPAENAPETKLNLALIEELNTYDTIWIVGEAKSHCVANSLKQLSGFPDLIRKLVILEDCMSDVSGFKDIAAPIYNKLKKQGATFTTSNRLLPQ